MKSVFVDTSGFYACLDRTDPFHPGALDAFALGLGERERNRGTLERSARFVIRSRLSCRLYNRTERDSRPRVYVARAVPGLRRTSSVARVT